MKLHNPEYDIDFLVEQIASESPTFKQLVEQIIKDTDNEYKTNSVWLGTLQTEPETERKQIILTVTQDANNMIDED